MNSSDHDRLAARHCIIDAELQAIADCRIVDGDPAEIEWQLRDELEEIEFVIGDDFLKGRPT